MAMLRRFTNRRHMFGSTLYVFGCYDPLFEMSQKSSISQYTVTAVGAFLSDFSEKELICYLLKSIGNFLNTIMNFVEDCLDEIALEGLDGITLSALWIRLGARKPAFSLSLDDLTKEYIWHSIIRDNENLEFYELPIPRPPLVLHDRFKHTDLETGVVFQKDEYPEDIYPICVIKDPGGIMGSCKHFYDRINITESVRIERIDLVSIVQRQGQSYDRLVM